MQTSEQRQKAEEKAKDFVKRVNDWHEREKSAGVSAPGWPIRDTDLVCEAFELAFSLGGAEA